MKDLQDPVHQYSNSNLEIRIIIVFKLTSKSFIKSRLAFIFRVPSSRTKTSTQTSFELAPCDTEETEEQEAASIPPVITVSRASTVPSLPVLHSNTNQLDETVQMGANDGLHYVNIESIAEEFQHEMETDQDCDGSESPDHPVPTEGDYISLETETRATSPVPSIYKSLIRKSPPTNPMCIRYHTQSPVYMNANF